MEFKGTKGKWEFVNTELADFHLTTIICEKEVIAHINSEKSNRIANALLISKAPEMLEELNDTIDDLKILKSNILDASKTNNRWEGMPDVIQNWIDRKEELIKSATSFKV